MRWSVALCFGAALAAGSIGCRSHDKVESQLRAREMDVQHLKGELDRSEFQNGLLLREMQAVRGLPGPTGMVERPSEPYPVRSLRLGRGTRGRPGEHIPGDDALEVFVEPVDCDSQVIKAPGWLHVEALEVSTEGLKTPIAAWEIPPDQLRRTWQSGLFNTGYKLTLPWKAWPNTEKLRIIAHFKMLNGRIFATDRDITVRVVPAKYRPMTLTPINPLPLPTPTPGSDVGPAPTPEPSGDRPKDVIPKPDGPDPVLPKPTPDMTPAPGGPTLTGGRGPASAVQILRPIPAPSE